MSHLKTRKKTFQEGKSRRKALDEYVNKNIECLANKHSTKITLNVVKRDLKTIKLKSGCFLKLYFILLKHQLDTKQ